jgi:dihydrofolate reductase
VAIIVAVATNGVIGRHGGLPWRLSADLRRFRRLTMGHHLIMGRRTYASIGRPLPGRTTVVLTSDLSWEAEGVEVAHSLDEAIEVARRAGDDEVFLAGGSSVYREGLKRAERIYLTEVHAAVEGDTVLPAWDRSDWQEIEREDRLADETSPLPHSFVVLDRRHG